MKTQENGRSMVEMLGVLAIIGVLSAGGLAGYSKAMFKHKLNSTMEQVTMLVTNIRTMYGTQGNYAGLTTDAVNLGIIPAVMGTDVSNLTNPFKGTVSLGLASTSGASGNTAFTVKYTGLPIEACIALASADFGSGAGSGFIGVAAANGDAADASAFAVGQANDSRDEGKPYKVDDAIDACNGSGSDTSQESSVQWKFY